MAHFFITLWQYYNEYIPKLTERLQTMELDRMITLRNILAIYVGYLHESTTMGEKLHSFPTTLANLNAAQEVVVGFLLFVQ